VCAVQSYKKTIRRKKMTYGTQANVKERLAIPSTEARYDTQIDNKITQVDALIDNKLTAYVTVPLGSPPQIINDICDDWAAGLFREEREELEDPSLKTDKQDVLTKRAKEALEEYINTTYLGPKVRGGYFRKVRYGT
jgi:phage gp36-like protein